MNKIYFYGILPAKGKRAYGGGEVGCQRTLDFLRKGGYDVTVIRRISVKADTKRWQATLSYPFRTVYTTVVFFLTLLFGTRKAIVHLSCFYGVTIYSELILLRIAKFLGYKVVCELRAGGAQYFYDNGSLQYKKHFEELVGRADFIFSQGKENYPLIAKFSKVPVFYYPNCINDNFGTDKYPYKPSDSINVIYFGRITESKNLLFIIEVVTLLQKKLNKVTLTIIGSGVDSYIKKVKQAAKENLKDGSYTFLPSMMHDQLKNYLADKHIYLFPSEEKREGHSNAVTEVMAWGIVPVASPQGFNKTVIGCDELIVPILEVEKYADAIISIFNEDKFEYLSRQVFQRVQENYTESIVFANLMNKYKDIFNSHETH